MSNGSSGRQLKLKKFLNVQLVGLFDFRWMRNLMLSFRFELGSNGHTLILWVGSPHL